MDLTHTHQPSWFGRTYDTLINTCACTLSVKCPPPHHNLTLGAVTSSSYMDRVADREMLILIWKLRQSHGSHSLLSHKAHDGVCTVISSAHLNRILDAGMLSLRQLYSVTVPASDGRLTAENIQIGCGKECSNSLCTFPLCLSKAGGLVGGAQMWHSRSRVLQAPCGVCVCVCWVLQKRRTIETVENLFFLFILDKTVCGILRNCLQMLTSCYTPEMFVLSHIIASVFVKGLLQDMATGRPATIV